MNHRTQENDEKAEKLTVLRHTIKNDLSVIIAFAQLVKMNPNDPKAMGFLSKIEVRSKKILSNIESYIHEEIAEES